MHDTPHSLTSSQMSWRKEGNMYANILVVMMVYLAVLPRVPAIHNSQLAVTPPMGWNSWNTFVCDDLYESVIRETVELLVSTGLASAGYTYVNIDDCWQLERNATGHIQADASRFPGGDSGMKELGDFIHTNGLMFGIYTDIGSMTCQRRPGSHRHEEIDAELYASWGVDFLKNDDCYEHPSEPTIVSYTTMYESLLKTQRPIIHSIKSSLTVSESDRVAHMRRVGVDIGDDWALVMHLVDVYVDQQLWKYSHPGFWSDLDMLVVGNGAMSETEYVAHMALWCAFKAPLLLGNDLSTMSNFTLDLLKHDELLAINQDVLATPVRWIKSQSAASDGGMAHEMVVSLPCDGTDSNQQWIYTPFRTFVHAKTKKCLTMDDSFYLLIADCDSNSGGGPDHIQNQIWSMNDASSEIHPITDDSLCITLSRESFGEAKVRPCDERSQHLDWQGPVQHYMGFQESFSFETVAENTFIFRNKNDLCPSVGAKAEMMYFAGPLSNSRQLLLVVNRDYKEHNVKFDFSLIVDVDMSQTYTVRDIVKRETLGHYKDSLSIDVEGHSVFVATLEK